MKQRKTLCRHCHTNRANRSRGLCWRCYYTPGLKERYGPISPFGRRSEPPDFVRPAPLLRPTEALPGSDEKVRVLEERARLGQALHHLGDARWDGQGAVPLARSLAQLGGVDGEDEGESEEDSYGEGW